MLTEIYSETESRMAKAIIALKNDFNSVRAGRANPALLDRLVVEYYGVPTPIKQMANVSAPEPRLLVIQPWDKTSLPDIEKAIQKSDLGLTPNNDGSIIRLAIPQLTEERRSELVRVVRKKAEDGRVSVRNIRRDANDMIKDLGKEGEITEDEERKGQEQIQKITDDFINQVDDLLAKKEAEIMEV
ncbi:MAG: ribosome recycling factor [Firmicutes bacterium]|nr:ribosome recycling factor [Bacillota bacterium]